MRCQNLVPLLGAVAASPAINLKERQASRQVNIDLYLPEITFLGLGSPFVLQSVLLGAGYSSINGNSLLSGAGSLSQVFSQSATPLNTFVNQHIPPICQQQSSNNTKYNYSANALAAGYGGAAASSGSDGEAAAAGIAFTSFQSDLADASAYSYSSYNTPSDTSASTSVASTGNGYLLNVTVLLPTQGLSRQYQAGFNETVNVGVCAAQSSGAYAYASYNTTTTVTVNGNSYSTPTVVSQAGATCSAGAPDPNNFFGVGASVGPPPNKRDAALGFPMPNPFSKLQPAYALSSTLAAPKQKGGAQAFVDCNGFTQLGLQSIKYRLQIRGTFSQSAGFVGNITGTRHALSTASCS